MRSILSYTIGLQEAISRGAAAPSAVNHALAAAKLLSEQGIDVEIIDPRTLVPLDEDSILASVAKTGRLVVVDEARDIWRPLLRQIAGDQGA